MIHVTLKNGKVVDVPSGKVGSFIYKQEMMTILEGATLDIRDDTTYSAKTVASFRADEVSGFVVEPEPDEEAED